MSLARIVLCEVALAGANDLTNLAMVMFLYECLLTVLAEDLSKLRLLNINIFLFLPFQWLLIRLSSWFLLLSPHFVLMNCPLFVVYKLTPRDANLSADFASDLATPKLREKWCVLDYLLPWIWIRVTWISRARRRRRHSLSGVPPTWRLFPPLGRHEPVRRVVGVAVV